MRRGRIACSTGSEIVGKTPKKKARERLAGREKGKEREPVIISLTTLFRPLLARLRLLDFGCQTVEMSMS